MPVGNDSVLIFSYASDHTHDDCTDIVCSSILRFCRSLLLALSKVFDQGVRSFVVCVIKIPLWTTDKVGLHYYDLQIESSENKRL